MARLYTFLLILVFMLFAAFILFVAEAKAHSWYDGACCDEGDCQQTGLGEVERRVGGWYVVPTNELIPFDDKRIRRSLDPLIHRCVKPNASTRCLYIPEVGG